MRFGLLVAGLIELRSLPKLLVAAEVVEAGVVSDSVGAAPW